MAKLRADERGSALLIVFVMAAMIAIYLYSELPMVLFEARRAREQDLINRGNEYAHAVKLFVRKMGSYPPTLDALNDTNRMRFLRHRFRDPLTGSGDWRLLHAGPGGQIVDSRVNPILANGVDQNGKDAMVVSAAAISSAVDSSMTAFSGSISAPSSSVDQATLPFLLRQSSAVAANNVRNTANSTPPEISTNPTSSLLPSTPSETMLLAATQIQVGSATDSLAHSPGSETAGANSLESSSGSNSDALASPDTQMQGAVTPGSSALHAAGRPLANSTFGNLMSGGIAGVASKAAGHSIKSINNQNDFSLWEFYYNPVLDPMRWAMMGQIGLQGGQAGAADKTTSDGPNVGIANPSTTAPSANISTTSKNPFTSTIGH